MYPRDPFSAGRRQAPQGAACPECPPQARARGAATRAIHTMSSARCPYRCNGARRTGSQTARQSAHACRVAKAELEGWRRLDAKRARAQRLTCCRLASTLAAQITLCPRAAPLSLLAPRCTVDKLIAPSHARAAGHRQRSEHRRRRRAALGAPLRRQAAAAARARQRQCKRRGHQRQAQLLRAAQRAARSAASPPAGRRHGLGAGVGVRRGRL